MPTVASRRNRQIRDVRQLAGVFSELPTTLQLNLQILKALQRKSGHSRRKAIIGSMRKARRAGM
jgi:hypothetical protein